MTGVSIQSKQQRKREISRKRQAVYRQKKVDQGLVSLNLQMTARAHRCLVELKSLLNKGSLADALMAAVEAQHSKTPPLPRHQPGDPAGVSKQPFWVTPETSDNLNSDKYKHRWLALSAFIIAHHTEVSEAQ